MSLYFFGPCFRITKLRDICEKCSWGALKKRFLAIFIIIFFTVFCIVVSQTFSFKLTLVFKLKFV